MPQIFFLKVECTFLFLNFLVIGLYSSSANYTFINRFSLSEKGKTPPDCIILDK